jgi:alkyldihydroxyacetonephosphate synthase
MMRLSTAEESTTMLALAGHELLVGTLERLLSIRGLGESKCLLLLGFSGSNALVKMIRKATLALAEEQHGIHIGRAFGHQWHKGRFRTPYLRNSLWEAGYAVDTVETATTWDNVADMIVAIETALRPGLKSINERVYVFTHLSHVYPQGASIYTTYLYRIASDPDETLRRWQVLKTAVSQAIVANKGTISHQHGVGADHASYLEAEKGPLGLAAIGDVLKRFDPEGVMNPGKLIL